MRQASRCSGGSAPLCASPRRFSAGGVRCAWEFARGGEALEIDVDGPLVLEESALVSAALNGIGLAFVYEDLVAG